MLCLNAAQTIIGISKETETYEIRGLDSHDSPYWTKKQTTSRPDYLWPEIWKDMSEAAQRKETPKWAFEKPTLDNAGRLRGLYFIDPADAEFKETIEHARRKLAVMMPAAMLCKIRGRKYKETCRTPDAPKAKYACIVEADESTRKRLERTLHKDHEGHIARKGINSLNHYNLVHKFIPMPQAMKITDAKAAVDKECENLRKYRHGS